jgi:hypothetical protein
MAEKQIVEFTSAAPEDTDLLVKQAATSVYEKCTVAQMKSHILAAIPAAIKTIDRPALTNTTISTSDVFEVQRPSDESYNKITLDHIYLYMMNRSMPIGSYYCNYANATNPSTLLGFGTWVRVRGRVIIGEGTGTDVNGVNGAFAAGTTGGEYIHVITQTEMANHTHLMFGNTVFGVDLINGNETVSRAQNSTGNNQDYILSASAGIPQHGTTGGTGSSVGHNNIQPYETAYIWRRTA